MSNPFKAGDKVLHEDDVFTVRWVGETNCIIERSSEPTGRYTRTVRVNWMDLAWVDKPSYADQQAAIRRLEDEVAAYRTALVSVQKELSGAWEPPRFVIYALHTIRKALAAYPKAGEQTTEGGNVSHD